jgi:hypothetical protein
MGAWTGHEDVVVGGATPTERAAPALDPVAALLTLVRRLSIRLWAC